MSMKPKKDYTGDEYGPGANVDPGMKLTQAEAYVSSLKWKQLVAHRTLCMNWTGWKTTRQLADMSNARGLSDKASRDTLGPRLKELEIMGFVKPNDQILVGKSPRGRRECCYRITDTGFMVIHGDRTLWSVGWALCKDFTEARQAKFAKPMRIYTSVGSAFIQSILRDHLDARKP